MPSQSALNIAIIGGSLAGLSTALVLSHENPSHTITILERAPTSHLQNQGAGIVAGPSVQELFAKYDSTRTPITITSQTRQYLNRSGEVIDSKDQVQQMTSWDLLYNVLRRCTDGGGDDAYFRDSGSKERAKELKGRGRGNVRYLYGCKVVDLRMAASVVYSERENERLWKRMTSVVYVDLEGREERLNVHVVFGADGPSSTIRRVLRPEVERKYAGYVAWRGTVPETELSPETLSCFSQKFTFFHTTNLQILAYLIPGPSGTLAPNQRLINYVWYSNYAPSSPELTTLMTDSEGKSHAYTLPAGKMQPKIWEEQKRYAERILPRQFSEVVGKTKTPFVQAVTDVICDDGGVVEGVGGRFGGMVVLVGDAVAGFRPHTAGSTGQACWHALLLGEVSEFVGGGGEGKMGLGEWEGRVLAFARRRQGEGVVMGDRSQFGSHPLADDEYGLFAASVRED